MAKAVSPLPTEERFMDAKYQLIKSLASGATLYVSLPGILSEGPLPEMYKDIADIIQISITSDPGNSTSTYPTINGVPLQPGETRTFTASQIGSKLLPQSIIVNPNGQKLYAGYLVRRK